MEERKEIEGHGVKAQEVKKEDKKAGPRLIDFLGRKKDSDKKVDKKDAPIKEREETSLKPAEPQSATGSSGSSPTKGKDTASAGFTLKKIFGRKDEDTADEYHCRSQTYTSTIRLSLSMIGQQCHRASFCRWFLLHLPEERNWSPPLPFRV